MKKRIAVTGIGVVTPIGLNINEFWKNLIEGKSGSAYITRFDASNFETKFACEVKNFNPLNYFDRKSAQRLDIFTQFALVSTEEAIQNSQLKIEQIDKNKVGIVFGSGIGGMWTWENIFSTINTGGYQRISPFFVPMMISDIAAGQIAIKYGFKGLNYATTSACATSAHAIAVAAMHIERGDADIVIAGGSEASISPIGIGGFNAMKALSTRNDEPEKASRPFDKNRDGFVMGEGSATLILEDFEFAVKRGAPILAELVGIGMTADAYHVTAPAPGGEGAVRSMRLCIEDANISPEEVDYINAHGTSTPYNDKNETEAIKTLFGEHAYKLIVSSTKSMTGHLLGAAGALEAVATILTVMNDIIPPTINLEEPDPECDLNYAPNKAVERKVNYAISNAFGFGGHNVSLLFKKYQ